MSVNYIFKNKVIYSDRSVKKIKTKDLKDFLFQNNMFQVAPTIYINLDNVSEIDFVNHVVLFDNGDKIGGIIKKIVI